MPDLVIVDLIMPEVTGYDVCTSIRDSELTCTTPIIVLTGESSEGAHVTSPAVGADDVLTKPFDLIEVEGFARDLIRLQRMDKSQESVESLISSISRMMIGPQAQPIE